ncbi:dCTP deaminase [Cardinium endosymbiont of Nabis limbatus]|uniref:dCTP deaminase n=1 Tax=Cardinium endosymbiont of Nabis limbatus TaxID=3066217 RepID=UPI003AF3B9AC
MQQTGKITIDPYVFNQINPNSYSYRLGLKLGIPETEAEFPKFNFIDIPKEGYELMPHTMYLGHTYEVLGSSDFAMRLVGRGSVGRYGLFIQVSADLGHTGASHKWTLEIVATKPIILYPYMIIGQISFWENFGKINHYKGGYSAYNDPTTSTFTM